MLKTQSSLLITQSFSVKSAYKPHSVCSKTLRILELGNHLSGSCVTTTLLRPTRMSNGTSSTFILLGLAPGGVCLAGDITATAGGLLHHRFTLTYCCRSNNLGNTPLCCTIPAGHPARPLAGTMLCGVRTFLSRLLGRDYPANLIL